MKRLTMFAALALLLAFQFVAVAPVTTADNNPDCEPGDDAIGCAASCLQNCGGGWVDVQLMDFYQYGTDVVCNCTCVSSEPGFQRVCIAQPGSGGPWAPPRDPSPDLP